VRYDLSDVTVGRGTAGDPISFFDLAEGDTKRVAAVSFFQLLVLRSWDIIDIKQRGSYEDLQIVRTVRNAV
jgi:chromatin segregation and condensation protein Rec8/ScpA/Scc1 (kleisin family)